ncbi:DUF2264 domain-containing protein [Serinibacter salmoneus]|uniref:DUF2264 domain-containing protein n=1 Tax=Serinibacter salmoneus TaxID=556530 RepID=A0A2A9CY49_9MICO|nr:DUF2264 domain-containing protein [Serinibacter salmoneus]PFG19071.1 hypothetical protein ATL40_0625 [Serinibacter salmoneus]
MSTRTPITTRADLAQFTDGLLLAARRYSSPSGALLTLPGTPGGYGTAVDGLEGFARTLLAAGFRIAGEGGADPHGLLERYAAGLAAGTDPRHPERWVRPREHGQAKVEAASLALVLDLTRPWLWDALHPRVQEQVVDYLAEVVGDRGYPRNNWLWFRLTVETFLRSVGGPHSLTDMAEDLERHDSYYERDGWYRDGEARNYDHYVGWAMHLYPTLWSRMAGACELAADRVARDRERLDRYLLDAVHLVGADGAPLPQGRSLTYRFAAAAPYWVGALAEVPSVRPGLLRTAALEIVEHFAARGVPNARGLLDIGWFGPWRPIAQSYTGTGSPYWASKGLLGLLMPAEHPVWTDPAQPLPASTADHRVTIAAPAWVVSSTAADGIVRVVNHGADHQHPGDTVADSPLYTRLAYSTGTFPLHRGVDWHSPVDQSVVLVDADGARSHRSGMRSLGDAADLGSATVIGSVAEAHWLTPDTPAVRHGAGLTGASRPAGTLTTLSVVRGAWEVRLVHLAAPAHEAASLQAGGWPIADDAGVEVTLDPDLPRIDLASTTHRAALVGLHGWEAARAHHRDDASPLGAHAVTGVLTSPAGEGWHACALHLAGVTGTDAAAAGNPPVAAPQLTLTDSHARIAWADGATTQVALPHPGATTPSGLTPPTPGTHP